MKDTTKVILAVLGGFVIGAKVQELVNLKRVADLKQTIHTLRASNDQAWEERNKFVKMVDDLRRDNFVLQNCNDAQGVMLIEQQRKIKDLKGRLYN